MIGRAAVWPAWWLDPLLDQQTHRPGRDLDPIASALAGRDAYRAYCACGQLDDQHVFDGSELWAAYAEHMEQMQAAARTAAAP
ncbi:hypothetical protein [Nonomuraea dietziae]|uniref:hypothetical protein n=1 Tax=Nonomuraea dietziae TaxID=65515 RepID=UPI0033E378B5